MKKIIIFILILCFCVSAFGCNKNTEENNDDNTITDGIDRNSEKMFIVDNGVSEYKIVLPSSPSDAEKFASLELQYFLNEATGANLAIVKDDTVSYNKDSKLICIGKNSLINAANLEVDYDKLNTDGFIIYTDGNQVFINGARDRGTLYGVYDFLEKFSGVKFIAKDCTYVPKAESIYVYEKMNIVEIPAFELRSCFIQDIKNNVFSARSRTVALWDTEESKFGYGLNYDFYDIVHNTTILVPKTNFAAHPELFAYINGNRRDLDICWSNGITADGSFDSDTEISTAKLMLESLKQFAAKYPNARYFMVGQEDSLSNFCSCDKCSATRNKYGAASASIIIMINAVAKEFQLWAETEYNGKREVNLVMFSYTYTSDPPVKVDSNGNFYTVDDLVIPADNVYIRIATADQNQLYPIYDSRQTKSAEYNYDYVKSIDGWKSITDNFFGWNYVASFNNHLWYNPSLRNLKTDYQMFEKLGVKYMFSEGAALDSTHFQAKLTNYVTSKLLWNTGRNVNELIDEFLYHYYGDIGSKYVSRYITGMEDHLNYLMTAEETKNALSHMGQSGWFNYKWWPEKLIDKSEKLLKSAISAVNNSQLTDEEKQVYITRLYGVMVTPMMMKLTNYNNYYGLSGYTDYAESFFDIAEKSGMKLLFNEALETSKARYGLA